MRAKRGRDRAGAAQSSRERGTNEHETRGEYTRARRVRRDAFAIRSSRGLEKKIPNSESQDSNARLREATVDLAVRD